MTLWWTKIARSARHLLRFPVQSMVSDSVVAGMPWEKAVKERRMGDGSERERATAGEVYALSGSS